MWWNGRHAGFRSQCRKAWRFKSSHPHHGLIQFIPDRKVPGFTTGTSLFVIVICWHGFKSSLAGFAILDNMNYKAVLFDMDGVIVDSEPLHVAAFQATLKNYGHDLTGEQYKQHFAGRTDEAGFKQYF